MITGGVNAASALAEQNAKMTSKSMGKDDFLKLLVTQLQNQDPLNPTDNTEFVAQLAQFSSLEGITNLNTSMETMGKSISSMQGFSSASLIGKTAKIESHTVGYSSEPVDLGVTVKEASANTELKITNGAGRLVRTIDLGARKAGEYVIRWDGKDNKGVSAPAGYYNFVVNASTAENKEIETATFVTDRITGVNFDSGEPLLKVGGVTVPKNGIKEIYQ